MDGYSWDHELSLFAEDLFSDLMSRHPYFRTFSRKYGGSRYFTSEIGKCVMMTWHDIRQVLGRKLRSDFPRFVKSEKHFKQYLRGFVDFVMQTEHNVINRILGISAILFEIVCFVYRRRMTYIFGDASRYLYFMLLSIKTEEPFEKDVLVQLAAVSAQLTEGYNEVEICRQYLLENVINYNPSNSTTTNKTNLTLKYSTKEHDATLNEESTEIKIKSKNSVVDSAKSNEHLVIPKQRLLSQAGVSQDVSESVKKVEESSTDSSKASLKLEISQTKLESLEQSTERMPDNGETSVGELSKFSTECIKSRAEDVVEPIDGLVESHQAQTSLDSEYSKELENFLTEAILSNSQLRFLTKWEDMEFFSGDTLESTAKNSYPHTSPRDKVNNTTDEPKTNPVNSSEQNYSDVPSLKGDGGIQTAVESVNNPQKSTKENLENTETLPIKATTCTELLCANDNSKKNCSSDFKSPKLETCEKSTPVKAKTPSSEKRGVPDVKHQTATPESNRKGTPIKTPSSEAPQSSHLSASTGKNKNETQTPKTLKSDSVKSKSSKSPAPVKTPTDRGLSNFKLKSSEKTDRGQKLWLPKSSPGIKKNSPRSISASAAKIESCTKDFSATDSFKPLLTGVEKSKLGAKDLSSNQLKSSSSTTFASVPKSQVTAENIPLAREKFKSNLQPSSPKTEKVKEGTSFKKAVGSCSAKSTNASEVCIPDKTSKEPLDTRSDAEETPHTQKWEEKKGKKKPIASASNANCSAGRTRNAPGKHPSMDSKNEKPRWR